MSKIISLSEAASIGIHGVVLIAQSESLMNVQHIADATGSSRHHVAKIMQRLVKDGYLTSSRGPSGGFSLKKPASEINLLQIYESIEGKVEKPECPVGNTICPFDKCLMGGVVTTLTNDFGNYLQSQTIDKFLKK
ncbi:MAG: Rrf2 family transcriptional regulator [Lentimicrobiaceae bacterium]|nr:Rrf2 family transcriptional regulator [Lentimicrobiaceae bacterium]